MQGAKAFSDLTESKLRLTSVFAGTVTILLFGAAAEMFGFVHCLVAALLFALLPCLSTTTGISFMNPCWSPQLSA